MSLNIKTDYFDIVRAIALIITFGIVADKAGWFIAALLMLATWIEFIVDWFNGLAKKDKAEA